MNVRRGLFRLWIVLTAVWAVFVVALVWQPFVATEQFEARRDLLQFAAGMFAVPPAVVLALGAALFWALSGFVRPKQ